MPDRTFEVAVIGGGPAGAAAAATLGALGRSVAVVEAGHHPRDKA